jgi:hypothetical protein
VLYVRYRSQRYQGANGREVTTLAPSKRPPWQILQSFRTACLPNFQLAAKIRLERDCVVLSGAGPRYALT